MYKLHHWSNVHPIKPHKTWCFYIWLAEKKEWMNTQTWLFQSWNLYCCRFGLCYCTSCVLEVNLYVCLKPWIWCDMVSCPSRHFSKSTAFLVSSFFTLMQRSILTRHMFDTWCRDSLLLVPRPLTWPRRWGKVGWEIHRDNLGFLYTYLLLCMRERLSHVSLHAVSRRPTAHLSIPQVIISYKTTRVE